MQGPNHETHPPRKPYGPRIAVFTQRYPPPVSGNAEPSSMYAIAVNRVTPKFRTTTPRGGGAAGGRGAHPRLDRPLEGRDAPAVDRAPDVLVVHGAELHARLEDGAFAVTAPEESRQRIACGGHIGDLRRCTRRCPGAGGRRRPPSRSHGFGGRGSWGPGTPPRPAAPGARAPRAGRKTLGTGRS